MESVSLNIKNMVCPRCIFAVENIMAELGIRIKSIDLGHVMVVMPKTVQLDMIKDKLSQLGFELIREKDDVYVEKIKILVIEYLKLLEDSKEIHVLSDFLARSIGKNYNYLTRIFSQKCGLTVEQYFIKQRLQRVKELLDQNELNVTEISYKLCYSSVNYLSTQFKKYVGVSISQYKSDLGQMKTIYKDISTSINALNVQGIQLNFTKLNDKYYSEEIDEYFNEDCINKIEKYEHIFGKDNSKIARVSVIETDMNLRGVYIEMPENTFNKSKVLN